MMRAAALTLLMLAVQAPSAAEPAAASQAKAAEQEDAASQGMLLAGIATALIVVGVLGGLAVYVTRRHQAVPTIQDM